MSSFHTAGFSAINLPSICTHSLDARSITLIPFSCSQSIPPRKFTDSPTITVAIPNCRINPLQYQHGASVVTMILSRYVFCRPALRKASVSPCAEGSPSCTLRLWPLPKRFPVLSKSAAPIGIPPSANPRRASSIAVFKSPRSFSSVIANVSRISLVSDRSKEVPLGNRDVLPPHAAFVQPSLERLSPEPSWPSHFPFLPSCSAAASATYCPLV